MYIFQSTFHICSNFLKIVKNIKRERICEYFQNLPSCTKLINIHNLFPKKSKAKYFSSRKCI